MAAGMAAGPRRAVRGGGAGALACIAAVGPIVLRPVAASGQKL